MKILICTGIYPPLVGGPAQYAKEIEGEFRRQGHSVKILTYVLERKLPPIIRHKLFFWRSFFVMFGTDFVIALDTFSVGFPAVCAANLLQKKIIIRTGGDFLWESYVERTGDLILFKDFYQKRLNKLNLKEKLIFLVTRFTLENASAVVFSTQWQRDIFTKAYSLKTKKNFVIENFYGPKIESHTPSQKVFVAGARNLKLKNFSNLKKTFSIAQKNNHDIKLDLDVAPYEKFLKKIQSSYAVISVSLSEVSPNLILDALRSNKPFICTRETGLYNKLKDVGIFVDPNNPEEIAEKISYLASEDGYRKSLENIRIFTYTHSWTEIINEFCVVYKALSLKGKI